MCRRINLLLCFILLQNISVATDYLLTLEAKVKPFKISDTTTRYDTVRYLDLSDLKASFDYSSILKFYNVENIDLSYNKIIQLDLDSIFDILGQLNKLKRMSLALNKITSLPENIYKLHKLIWLSLDDNALQTLPNNFIYLQNLRTLILGERLYGMFGTTFYHKHNEFNQIPIQVYTLTQLETLKARCIGEIDSIPFLIGRLKNLKYLDLVINKIAYISDSISHLQNLKEIYLDRNNLTSFPIGITKLKKLSRFSISSNQIKQIPESIKNLKNLSGLILRGCGIQSLPNSINKLKKLKFIALDDNPNVSVTNIKVHKGKPKISLEIL